MRVVVIGGGFAGRAAAKKLYDRLPFAKRVELVLVDQNEYTTMLPSLPDVAGNKIRHQYVKESLEKAIPNGVRFLNRTVDGVSFNSKTIQLDGGEKLPYDYLIFAPGSKANYEGCNEDIRKGRPLDSLKAAMQIRNDYHTGMMNGEISDVVIAGGSFTGVELACTLDEFAKACGKKVSIWLVVRSGRLLPLLNEQEAAYAQQQLSALGINILFNEEVVKVEDKSIKLKSGKSFEQAFFCWCGGVKIAIEAEGSHQKLTDGRIKVDEHLRIPEHPEVFVAGDAAAVEAGAGVAKSAGSYIRRSVNYSTKGGEIAGHNAAATLEGERLKEFKYKDKGWVIPMHTTSVGNALGFKVKNRTGLFLHYVMCGATNYNARNFRKYVKTGLKCLFGKID